MTERISVNSTAKLSDVLSYCPGTGVLKWKVARGRCSAGSVAGYDTGRGYIGVRVNGQCMYAHRVAFEIMTGRPPFGEIDHINGVRGDNSWKNLREVCQHENMLNRSMARSNKSGVIGVFWNTGKGKWTAKIKKHGKDIHLGHFSNISDAAEARKKAEAELGFHENHGRAHRNG